MRALTLVVLVGLLVSCSSPTAPSPPAGPTPPTAPQQPPADPRPPLTIACPANATVNATTTPPVAVSFPPPVVDGGVAPVQVSCTRQSGSLFAAGETSVQCTATDSASPAQSASCVFTVTVNPPVFRLSRTRFLAFGDSITAGEVTVPAAGAARADWPLVRYVVVPAASYPSQLAALLRARYTAQAGAIAVVNDGRPGEWAEDGARRLPGAISAARPEVLLLLHGYNELAASPSTGPTRAAVYIDQMAKEGRNRGARVFVATLTPPRAGFRALPASAVVDLNARIRAIAIGEGAVLVDLYAALVGDTQRYIGVDGLHPTEDGYARMAQAFFDAVRAELDVR